MSRLDVQDLSVVYGGLVANDRVSLSVEAGEVAGLIGPNGAGKSTFVDAVTGFTTYSGAVGLDGRSLDSMKPHERVRAGLSRTWQSGELFDDLTARDILALGGRSNPDRVLEAFGLTAFARSRPNELSLGSRKLLGLARAVASAPAAIMLDEPAAGLDIAERQHLEEHIRALASKGMAVLLIDHDVRLVLGVCDSVTVLDFGRVIAAGTPDAVRADAAVVEAYLGEVA